MNKKWARILLRRRVLVMLLLLLQLFMMGATIYHTGLAYKWIYNILNILSVGVVLHVITSSQRASYKLLWTVMILLFPLFGGVLYILVRLQSVGNVFKRQLDEASSAAAPYFASAKTATKCLEEWPQYQHDVRFLTRQCGFGVYSDTKTEYLTPGEEFFERLLTDLGSAKQFIFLEYFIIAEGRFWSEVLSVLKRKAAEGVDVRLIYDDMGCFFNLPLDYEKTLKRYGIRSVVFNKFRPALSTLQNNRDHRKIAVIDGRVAYTGGINIADEYINEKERFGHWKDAAVRMEGAATDGFTLLFLTMWRALTGEQEDLSKYQSCVPVKGLEKGFLIPFCDSPIDNEYVSEQVYLNLINSAKKTLYIQTPYLILDDLMVTALVGAAKNGVDVRIITPGVPDKKYVHITTRSYYKELVTGGVKIYEYTPGFIHSKVLCADDESAVVGTVNLDCRSLYLHYECGVWLCGEECIAQIREDFEETQAICTPITASKYRCTFLMSIVRSLFRLFAPLL